MSRRETCAKCRHWDPVAVAMGERPERGECRRQSPQWHPDAMFGGVMASWPQTLAGDWCGEYDYRVGSVADGIAFPGLPVVNL